MCGIAAIAGTNLDPKRYNTAAMLAALAKRGPDGEGESSQQGCWLGHRRLAIIDLSPTGKQPMKDSTRAVSVAFNGEIYNYKDLRGRLEARGHVFTTNSDTEAILKTYLEYGTECPKHLDGMFAFAIWDAEKQTLFIARDRFGKKPLYYCFDGDTILIASEIKSLLASGRVKGTLSREAIDNYLRLTYIPPWKSVYENIFQLPPAHSGVFKAGHLSTERYWSLAFNPLSIPYEEAKEETRRLLREAVQKRMLASDVEVGSLLSGGVDSTIVSLLAAESLDHPLKTFALGYGDYINELPFAEQAAQTIRSEHHTLQASSDRVDELEKVIRYFDEPHADTSDFPQHLVSELAASKVKVALSGDGGDEVFMGYGWHTRHHNLSYRAHTFEKLFLNPFQGRVRVTRVFKPLERATLWGSLAPMNNDIYAADLYDHTLDPMQKITTFDLTTYLPGQLLSKVDRTAMMHGLEVRSPLLDTALVEFVCNLPTAYKATNKEQKIILKDLLAERMPKEFVYRRKQGFGAPIGKWLREPRMTDYLHAYLGKDAEVRKLFNEKPINFYLKRFYEQGDNRPAHRLWVLLCLEIWLSTRKSV